MSYLIARSRRFTDSRSWGLLLIRIAIGSLFLMHGLSKVQNLGRTAMMFAGMGFPGWVGYFIAWLEVLGGAALILGIFTWIFGLLFGIEMLVAVFLGGFGRAFGGIEFLLSLASFGIALTGSGSFSLFPLEYERMKGFWYRGPQDAADVAETDVVVVED